MNDYLRTVVVAPMTNSSSPAPFRVAVRFKGKSGLILPDQIRMTDRTRLVERMGKVDAATMSVLASRADGDVRQLKSGHGQSPCRRPLFVAAPAVSEAVCAAELCSA
jgi:hypothetical protein